MDPLEYFSLVVHQPIKIKLLKFVRENNLNISYLDIYNYFSGNKFEAVQALWELYNDNLLEKRIDEKGYVYGLSIMGLRLCQILSTLEQWSLEHQLFGGW